MTEQPDIKTNRADFLRAILSTMATLKKEAEKRGLDDMAELCDQTIATAKLALAREAN
jgi:hypothetical protein